MELLKKILVVITGILLIALVIYIINVSQKAHKVRERSQIVPEQSVPEPAPPESDTVRTEPLPPDVSEKETKKDKPKEEPAPLKPDTLNWNRLDQDELQQLQNGMQFQNPNPLFTSATKKILPAVATIKSERVVSNIPKDEDHQFFWERHEDEGLEFFQKGSGSGIIISSDGYVMTNYHVIENATEYNIILYDKREFKAKYIGGDPNTDIAVLKMDAQNLPAAYIGNSDSVQIGEWVIAVGSPLNFTSTVTTGIISALGRDIRIIDGRYGIENFIQTDAVINPGNSGGALVNLNGELVGVNTAIATKTGLYQGYGFAVPSNLAVKVVDDILKYGEVRRGLLGVSISPVNNQVAKGVGLPKPMGVLVQGVESGFPAKKTGIKQGDIILKVNDQEVKSVNDLQIKIASKHPGDVVDLEIWRNEERLYFQVELGKAPNQKVSQLNRSKESKREYENLGLEFRDLTEEEKNRFQTEYGVYVTGVKPGSPAYKAGISRGYVIISLQEKKVTDSGQFEDLISKGELTESAKVLLRNLGPAGEVDDIIVYVEIE